MKTLGQFLIILFLAACGSGNMNVTGTATDVNSGTLSGIVTSGKKSYKESIDLYLCDSTNSIVSYQNVSDGTYSFDSIPKGIYKIVASIENNSVTLGSESDIIYDTGTRRDIPVSRIVKKSFSVIPLVGNSLDIDPFDISNIHVVEVNPNTIQFTLSEGTVRKEFTIEFQLDNVSHEADLSLEKTEDNVYTVSLLSSNAEIMIVNKETVILTGTGNDETNIIIDGIIK